MRQLVEVVRRHGSLAGDLAPEVAGFAIDKVRPRNPRFSPLRPRDRAPEAPDRGATAPPPRPARVQAGSVRKAMLESLEAMVRVAPSPAVVSGALEGVMAVLMEDPSQQPAGAQQAILSAVGLFRTAYALAAAAQGAADGPLNGVWELARSACARVDGLVKSPGAPALVRVEGARFLEHALRVLLHDVPPPCPGAGAPTPPLTEAHPLCRASEVAALADGLLGTLLSLLAPPDEAAAPGPPLACVLAALSSGVIVLQRHQRTVSKVMPAVTKLAQQTGSGWAQAGAAGGSRGPAVAHAVRLALRACIRTQGSLLSAWRPRMARAMALVGFKGEGEKEVARVQHQEASAQRREAKERARAEAAAAREPGAAPRPDTPPADAEEASVSAAHHAQLVQDAMERAWRMGWRRDAAAAAQLARELPQEVLADVVLGALEHLPPHPPRGHSAASAQPGLLGLIQMLGLDRPKEPEAPAAGGAEGDRARAPRVVPPAAPVAVPALAANRLGDAELAAMREHAVRRVMEARVHGVDGSDVQRALVARLGAHFRAGAGAGKAGGVAGEAGAEVAEGAEGSDPAVEHIVRHMNRHSQEHRDEGVDMALKWLQAVALRATRGHPAHLEGSPYEASLGALLSAMRSSLAAHARTALRKVLADAPDLPRGLVQEWLLAAVREGADWAREALATCRDLLTLRPRCRPWVLEVVVEGATGAAPVIRDLSLRLLCNILWADEALRPLVEGSAAEHLSRAAAAAPVERAAPGQAPTEEERRDRARVSMYVTLCACNPGLLPAALERFPRMAPHVAEALTAAVVEVAQRTKALGVGSEALAGLLEANPEGSDPVLVHMVRAVTQAAPPPPAVLEALRRRGAANPRFMALALPFMKKQEAVKEVAVLTRVPLPDLQAACIRLAKTKVLPAIDLLVLLHGLPGTRPAIACLTHCLKDRVLRNVFSTDVVRAAIQRMLMAAPRPRLFMRTVLLALQSHDGLVAQTLNVLDQLSRDQIWTDADLWVGFVKCCTFTRPGSMKVLLALPPAQLTNAQRRGALDLEPGLAEPLLGEARRQKPAPPRATMEAIVAAQGPAKQALAARNAAAAGAAAGAAGQKRKAPEAGGGAATPAAKVAKTEEDKAPAAVPKKEAAPKNEGAMTIDFGDDDDDDEAPL